VIRKVWMAHVAKSTADFDALVRLLRVLGVRTEHIVEDESEKFAAFYPPVVRFDLVGLKKKGKDVYTPPDLWLVHSDPMSAFDIIRKLGFQVVSDVSGASLPVRSFRVKLQSGTIVVIGGPTLDGRSDWQTPEASAGNLNAAGKRFGIVVSRFNSFITERLLAGAIDGLLRTGAERSALEIVRVPGAFEIPAAARTMAETEKYEAIICIGCLLRGETAHYEVIANEVTRGIGQSAQETGVPHAFGVLTCDTLEQAIDRAGLKAGNKGFEAALAAVEMASLSKKIRAPQQKASSSHRSTATRKSVKGRTNKRKRAAKRN